MVRKECPIGAGCDKDDRAPPDKKKPRISLWEIRGINLAMTYSRGTFRPTTIGCSGLNGRVRDGNGWDPRQIITRKLYSGGAGESDISKSGSNTGGELNAKE